MCPWPSNVCVGVVSPLQPKHVVEPDSERPSRCGNADLRSSGALRSLEALPREDSTYSPLGVFAPLFKVGADAVHDFSK